MEKSRQIIFEHIPKTGGVTLRGILQKVYGADNIFLIESRSIGTSLRKFSEISAQQRNEYHVITGHGASMFDHFTQNPFRVTILRDPLRLFLSQYNFLKISPGTIYYHKMQRIKNIEAYIDFALENGQDNLLTRYLSNSMQWLVDEMLDIPDLATTGNELLVKAKENLLAYDAIINLQNFDAGVYALSRKLQWKAGIPIYKPSNRTISKKYLEPLLPETKKRLEKLLRFDVELFDYFLNNELDIALHTKSASFKLNAFLLRQQLIKQLARLMGKN